MVGSRATSVKITEVATGFKVDGKAPALRKESLAQDRAAEVAQNPSRSEGPEGEWGWEGVGAGEEMQGPVMFSLDCFPAFQELGNEVSASRW